MLISEYSNRNNSYRDVLVVYQTFLCHTAYSGADIGVTRTKFDDEDGQKIPSPANHCDRTDFHRALLLLLRI